MPWEDDEDVEARLNSPERAYVPSDVEADEETPCSSRMLLDCVLELSLERLSEVP